MVDGPWGPGRDDPDEASTVIVVPDDVTAVGCARAHLSEVVASWHVADLPTFELVATELITNAIVHAGSSAIVHLAHLGDGCIRIEVGDEAPDRPARIVPYDDHTRGLGLHIVDALCESWGVTEPGPRSKVVWATLRLDREVGV